MQNAKTVLRPDLMTAYYSYIEKYIMVKKKRKTNNIITNFVIYYVTP